MLKVVGPIAHVLESGYFMIVLRQLVVFEKKLKDF